MSVLDSFRVPRTEAGVRAARKKVQAIAETATPDRAAIGDVSLLAAEAITNAYLHGTGTISVAVIDTGACIRVEVADEGPAACLPGRVDNGRGLALIDGFSADWEFRERPCETVTWFEVKK